VPLPLPGISKCFLLGFPQTTESHVAQDSSGAESIVTVVYRLRVG
jgi:hypothetical protein